MASKINVDKIARNSGTPEFTVPTADGAANTVLQTDGSGVLSFTPNVINSSNVTYTGNSVLDIKNAGTASSIKVYCENSNAHYTEIKSGPHASATSYTITLPNAPPTVNGQFLSATTAGVGSWETVATSGFVKYTVVTSSDATFALTSGVTKVVVEVQASGADAGNNSGGGDNGGAGGAGAYARKLLTGMTGATDQLNITLGAVPGAATAGTTTSVAAAGTASFTTVTCTGGAGGAAGAIEANGGAGGALPTTGDVNIAGQNGTPGAAYGYTTGAGANSMLGFGGRRVLGTNGAGAAATGYGAGGGQGRGASAAGGSGGSACAIVWEYK
jgi:hypothetical protein